MVTHPLWRPWAPSANAQRQSERVAHRQVAPGPLQEHQARWASDYSTIRQLIVTTIPDQVLNIAHVGSTAVPGLIAKPVIDVDLWVPEVDEELQYLQRLESVGFRLIFRDDLGGDSHRHLTLADPNTNVHVWSPGAVEPQRHMLFARWLSDHGADRDLYAAAKKKALAAGGSSRYNDAKSGVTYDIYERAFIADPLHHHDPQPRPS